ncbi:hypothetical protein FVEG_15086 [Fusarium verticillioides 7600]|uniref:Uncharacterized protein n=1 Tax=Gibberella moniliformis (strain M3125 / FGSC 7600) TaxID=334819 RepID=W7LWV8_GIBM7|nr:hypothetical protein FVEG_15086 [Fusarium verticillioides 7600]EWG39879.1 hypothetical protein FVEG_15086 [Fusarium verticillioides 7600]
MVSSVCGPVDLTPDKTQRMRYSYTGASAHMFRKTRQFTVCPVTSRAAAPYALLPGHASLSLDLLNPFQTAGTDEHPQNKDCQQQPNRYQTTTLPVKSPSSIRNPLLLCGHWSYLEIPFLGRRSEYCSLSYQVSSIVPARSGLCSQLSKSTNPPDL